MLVSLYLFLVAPEIRLHRLPAELQRSHLYEYPIGAVPFQVPGDPLRRDPFLALPEIEGGDVLRGGAAATRPLGLDVAVLEPAEFCAVTATRSRRSTSAAVCL